MSETRQGRFESGLKLLSPLLAVAVFFWGIYTYRDTVQHRPKEEIEIQLAISNVVNQSLIVVRSDDKINSKAFGALFIPVKPNFSLLLSAS